MHPTMNGRSTRLGITFIEGKAGKVERLAFHQGRIDMQAARVKQP